MPTHRNGEAELFYEIEGEASQPVVTLLNGYSRTSSDFRSMSKFLSERGWRVIRIDNRGCGQTTNPPGFTVNDMVGDVVAIWDSLGIARSAVLGISYGGILSMLLGSQHAARVLALVLVSTTPSSFFLGLDNNLSGQAPKTAEENLKRYFSKAFAESNPVLFSSLVKETARAFHDPVLRERAKQQRAALGVFDFTALLHSIRAPTLIVHGTEDQVVPEEAADVVHRAIKGSTLKLIPGVGHLVLAEAAKLFFEEALAFLNQHREQSA